MSHATGKRVLLTRNADDNAEWALELRDRGFVPIECECLQEVRLPVTPILELELQRADWIAFGSRRAVDALHDAASQLPNHVQLAAVGPATAVRLHTRFGRCDCISEHGDARALGAQLVEHGAQHVLINSARGGRHEIEAALRSAGRTSTRLELYEMRNVVGPLTNDVDHAEVALFASPSAVNAFAQRGRLPATCVTVSIGPTTSAALRAAGLPVHVESHTRDLEGMLSALATLSASDR